MPPPGEPPILPLMPASLILINGASSAGKTTLCRAVRDAMPTPFLHFSLDFFMFGANVLPRTPEGKIRDWPHLRPHVFQGRNWNAANRPGPIAAPGTPAGTPKPSTPSPITTWNWTAPNHWRRTCRKSSGRGKTGKGSPSAGLRSSPPGVATCRSEPDQSVSSTHTSVFPSFVLMQLMYVSPSTGAPFRISKKLASRLYSMAVFPFNVGAELGLRFGYST